MTYHEAIDLGIAALDERRQKLLYRDMNDPITKKHYDNVNSAIALLAVLKERIGPDGTQRMF